MKTMISKFLNVLRFSKHDYVNHSACATVLYILLRMVFVALAFIVAVKPEYQAIAAAVLVMFFGGQLLEIYQHETKTGAAQGTDSLAVIIPAIGCLVAEFAVATFTGWYNIPGFDPITVPIVVFVILIALYHYLVIKNKFV
jgi:peptidoglycan/LPS O-acetylase OafA/YrhL